MSGGTMAGAMGFRKMGFGCLGVAQRMRRIQRGREQGGKAGSEQE
jgi:hypothetical protein